MSESVDDENPFFQMVSHILGDLQRYLESVTMLTPKLAKAFRESDVALSSTESQDVEESKEPSPSVETSSPAAIGKQLPEYWLKLLEKHCNPEKFGEDYGTSESHSTRTVHSFTPQHRYSKKSSEHLHDIVNTIPSALNYSLEIKREILELAKYLTEPQNYKVIEQAGIFSAAAGCSSSDNFGAFRTALKKNCEQFLKRFKRSQREEEELTEKLKVEKNTHAKNVEEEASLRRQLEHTRSMRKLKEEENTREMQRWREKLSRLQEEHARFLKSVNENHQNTLAKMHQSFSDDEKQKEDLLASLRTANENAMAQSLRDEANARKRIKKSMQQLQIVRAQLECKTMENEDELAQMLRETIQEDKKIAQLTDEVTQIDQRIDALAPDVRIIEKLKRHIYEQPGRIKAEEAASAIQRIWMSLKAARATKKTRMMKTTEKQKTDKNIQKGLTEGPQNHHGCLRCATILFRHCTGSSGYRDKLRSM